MKVTQKKIDDGHVRLDITATPEEVEKALHQAQIQFAKSMGLRPVEGKTIAQVAEEHMGIKDLDSIVAMSVLDALVPAALDKKNIIPAYPPQVQENKVIKRGEPLAFSVDVALKPEYELTSYDPIELVLPPFAIDESLVDQQIEQMAQRFTSYVSAPDKTIESGDICFLAIEATSKDKDLRGLNTEGRTYQTGEGYMPEGFDKAIIGMKPGETKTFTFEAPDYDDDFNPITITVDCTVTVKEIQQEDTPAIDDAWVRKNFPGHTGLDQLRQEITESLTKAQKEQYDAYCMQRAASVLAQRFQGSIADEVYEAVQRDLLENMHAEVKRQGKEWSQFVEEQGGEQQLSMLMMLQTRELITQGYALDALFRHQKLSLTDEDILAVCHSMNPHVNPKEFRKQFEQGGRGFALREAAERYKASKWLLEHAIVRTPEEVALDEAASAEATSDEA